MKYSPILILILSISVIGTKAFSDDDPNLNFNPQPLQKVQQGSIEPLEVDVPHHFNAGDRPVLSSCNGVKPGKTFEVQTLDGQKCVLTDGSKIKVVSRTFKADFENPKLGEETFIFEAHCKDGVRKFSGTDKNNPFTKFELEPGLCIDVQNGSNRKILSGKNPAQPVQLRRKTDK